MSAGPGGQPSEEELRAAYEAELARMSSADMILQSAVSLLNIGAMRLAPPPGAAGAPGPDLEQARDAIDAVGALLEILERRAPREVAPLRDALSRLQMAYAGAAQAPPPGEGAGPPPGEPAEPAGADRAPAGEQASGPPQQGEEQQGGEQPGERPEGPGPAEASGRLWVPGR